MTVSDSESRLIKARRAALELRSTASDRKNRVLESLAALLTRSKDLIISANQMDLNALPPTTKASFRDRLALDDARISQMAESLRQVAALPDPVGEIVEARSLPNGLRISRVRAPLGVILMIFESRPNVATEAFSLAFKTGNVILLRGGKESRNTTQAIYALMEKALIENGLPSDCFWGITNPDRALVQNLLQQTKWIDVVVPRGGDQLIQFVVENSRIPIIKNDRGLCHVYVHEDADLKMATDIVINAKVQRPGVCNSMETLLVHEKLKDRLLPALHTALQPWKVEWYGCPETMKVLSAREGILPATSQSWDTEYLDFKMNCRVVTSLEDAIAHIEQHGSRHSEAIITASEQSARRFQAEIDAAAVYWNASTRFTDGFALGLGGELGISTQKLHVRGPVGLKELTSERWIMDGSGQTRN